MFQAMTSLMNFPPLRYLSEARDELKKVTWPSKEEAITYTGFVIGISIVLALYLGGIDWLLTLGLQALLGIAK